MEQLYIDHKTTIVFINGDEVVFLPSETSYIFYNKNEVLYVKMEKVKKKV